MSELFVDMTEHMGEPMDTSGGGDDVEDGRTWVADFVRTPAARKNGKLNALLQVLEGKQLRWMEQRLRDMMKRDFISLMPHELALYLLSFLDEKSLCRASAVSRNWHKFACDDVLWKMACERVLNATRDPYALCKEFDGFTRINIRNGTGWKKLYAKITRIQNNWLNGHYRLNEVRGHDNHVITYLMYDDEKIVSASDDHSIKIWSIQDGKCISTLRGHKGGVWSCQVAGNIVVSGSTDRMIKIWDLVTGKCTATLEGHVSTVRCLCLVGNILVSGSRDKTLRLWDIKTHICLHTLRGHTEAVRSVQFDGRRVVSGSYDHTLRIWDSASGRCLHTLVGHTNKIYSVEFDGAHIASGSLDTTIRVWNVETGACLFVLQGHSLLVGLMQLRGDLLVTGNADKTLRVWNITTGECVHVLEGHTEAVTCVQFDSKKIVSGSIDGSIRIWDLASGQLRRCVFALETSGSVVWKLQFSDTKMIVAVRKRFENGEDEARLIMFDFDIDPPKSMETENGNIIDTHSPWDNGHRTNRSSQQFAQQGHNHIQSIPQQRTNYHNQEQLQRRDFAGLSPNNSLPQYRMQRNREVNNPNQAQSHGIHGEMIRHLTAQDRLSEEPSNSA
eukprot:CFRG1116T1